MSNVLKVYVLAIVTALLSSGLVAPAYCDEAALKTDKDRMNYSIGVDVIKNYKKQGIDVDLDLVIKGMKDALSGGKLLLTDAEMRKILVSVQADIQRRQKMAPVVAAREGQIFLAENKEKEGVVTLPDGLQYKILKAGEGKKPTASDQVECNYRGTRLDGSEFDRSYDKPVVFSVQEGGGIPGLSEALQLMPVGSRWQLFIPPQLAYGDRGRVSIIGSHVGPNETILMDVELLAIK